MKYFEHLALLKSIKGLGVAGINKNYLDYIIRLPDFGEFKEALVYDGIATELDISNAVSRIERTVNALNVNESVSIITCYDEEYPNRFRKLGNQKPLYVFAAGDISILNDDTVAVIGTRKPSEYGISATRKIIAEVKNAVIVSGLALGTDKTAHEAAIKNGLKTIAVLPSGFNNIVPISNKELAGLIAESKGCLISEYDIDEKPEKHTYLRRDELVAALSDVVVVIECGEKSGTMHTVESAIKLKKELCCYYTDRGGDYTGNRKLLDKGLAKRLLQPNDINNVIKDADKAVELESHQLSISEIIAG